MVPEGELVAGATSAGLDHGAEAHRHSKPTHAALKKAALPQRSGHLPVSAACKFSAVQSVNSWSCHQQSRCANLGAGELALLETVMVLPLFAGENAGLRDDTGSQLNPNGAGYLNTRW